MEKQLPRMFYSFIIIMLLFTVTNAQIVYTDLIPDQTFNVDSAVYHLDIDNNGSTDFDIRIHTLLSTHPRAEISIVSSTGNSVSSSGSYASALNLGATIYFTNMWVASDIFMERDFWTLNQHTGRFVHSIVGNWLNKTDKYLGFKFSSGANTYLGWARLDTHVNSNGTADFTIKDYAYNSLPNGLIHSGDDGDNTTGIILNSNKSAITLSPNPSRDHLIVSLPFHVDNMELTVADINGKIIYHINELNKQKIEIDTKDFSAGIYVLRIQAPDLKESIKFIVLK